MMVTIHLSVNGKKHTIQADPATPLLYVLRNQLALNGPKYGCGLQQCGSCMVLLDGKAQPSCMLPVQSVKNSSITTLEGLRAPIIPCTPSRKLLCSNSGAMRLLP